MKTLLILLIGASLLSGCAMLRGAGNSMAAMFQASDDDDNIQIIRAVKSAENVRILLWIGGVALVSGVALKLASNTVFPGSTSMGLGVSAGGGACIAAAFLAPVVQKVALPTTIVLMVLAVLYVAAILWRKFKDGPAPVE